MLGRGLGRGITESSLNIWWDGRRKLPETRERWMGEKGGGGFVSLFKAGGEERRGGGLVVKAVTTAGVAHDNGASWWAWAWLAVGEQRPGTRHLGGAVAGGVGSGTKEGRG